MRWFLLLLLLGGCGGGVSRNQVVQAARIANEIGAEPRNAALVLQAAGIDRPTYLRWLREIAADPRRSHDFIEALDATTRNPYAPQR